jgi:penicillin-binding protein 1B
MDALRTHLINTRGENDVLAGGFDVRIGLDTGLQSLAENTLLEFRNQHQGLYQALILAGDPRSCEIRAYAGGTLYRDSQLDRIRQSRRPSGSLVKPLLISDLLETQGHSAHLAMILKDEPLEWRYGRQVWKPVNYDNKFRGPVSLRQTLEESLNVPLVALFESIEPSGMLTDILDPLRAMGLEVPPERALPSAILGAIDQSPWATLQSYLKFTRRALGWADTAADLGCELQFEKRIPDEIATLSPEGGREDAYNSLGSRLAVSTLEGALRRGTSRGLGAKLPQDQAWAAKTGTSSDLRDSWFVAMSPELVVLSWVGRDDNQKTPFTGATGALPLAKPLIQSASSRVSAWNWPQSSKLIWKLVDVDSGCSIDDPSLWNTAMSASTSPPPGVFRVNSRNLRLELFIESQLAEPCPES